MSRNADFLARVSESALIEVETRIGTAVLARPSLTRIRQFEAQSRSEVPEETALDAVLDLLSEMMDCGRDDAWSAIQATGGPTDGDLVKGLRKAISGEVADAEAEDTAPFAPSP